MLCAHLRADRCDRNDTLRSGRDGSTPFIEVCIGRQMAAGSVLTLRMVERDKLTTSCDVLLRRSGDMGTNLTNREEVNEQCKK